VREPTTDRHERLGAARAWEPALDGLRAISLLAVLLFHAGFSWMSGGFLGVSTFFTLSGFLVTELLLRDLDRGGRVDVAEFWRRRLRRLAPASLAVLAVLAVVAPGLMDEVERARLGADLLAALGQVSNWRFLRGDYAYSLLFSEPSLVQHYWSLAIEAQFYVAFPLIVGVLARSRRPEALLAAACIAGIVAAGVASFVLGADAERWDRIYYGTDLRMPELLAGVLLALWIRRRSRASEASPPLAQPLALAALAASVVAWVALGLDSEALHRGGFLAYALGSVFVVQGCVEGEGVLRRALAWAPLVWMGRVSYGAYLIHWPIYVALDAGWPELSPLVRLAICAPLTFALAGLSARLLEEPARRGRSVVGRHVVVSTAVGMLVIATWVGLRTPIDAVFTELRGDASRAPASGPGQQGDVHIAMFGDSSALSLAWGFAHWANRNDVGVVVDSGVVELGCGLLGPAWIDALAARGAASEPWLSQRGPFRGIPRKCLSQIEATARYLADEPPDVALVLFGEWDVAGVREPGTDSFRTLGEPEVDTVMRRAIGDFVDVMHAGGDTRVVWLMTPSLTRPVRFPHDPAVWRASRLRLNALVREVHAAGGHDFEIVDLDAALARFEPGWQGEPIRHDGIHFTEEGAASLVTAGLGADVLEAAGLGAR